MSELTDALRSTRERFVREEYADRVKGLIGDELRRLEPDADIEDTLYFNHSAIPDFVVSWGSQASRREIFIRSSYASIVAANEVAPRAKEAPIFMALTADQDVDEDDFRLTPEIVRQSARSGSRALLTDSTALGQVSASGVNTTPLTTAVRANFLRGARGVVDEPVAESLLNSTPGAAGATNLIREFFVEDAVFRMERTAALVDWALSSVPEMTEVQAGVLNGTMTVEELRSVLPWLLRQEAVTRESRFWSQLGSMFSFDILEGLAYELEGLDITNLVEANLGAWSAKRSYLGLNITPDGTYDDHSSWRFQGGTLGLAVQERMVRISNSGHKLRTRPGAASRRWDDVRAKIAEYRVHSVSLSGIERSFRIEANQSEDINKDVQVFASTVEDDYFVDRVQLLLRVPEEDGPGAAVDVDFSGSMAIADRAVELGALVRVTLEVIGGASNGEQVTP